MLIMFNDDDVCFFNGVKMSVLNRDVANLIYTLTGMRTFKEVKAHFEDWPYDVITNNGKKYFICGCHPDSCNLDDSERETDFYMTLIIDSKTGVLMIRDITAEKIKLVYLE